METVKIGNLFWLNKNLHVITFQNGEPLHLAKSIKELLDFNERNEPCCCYYEFDEVNADYGLLYNWYAVADSRGLAPNGYRIANHEDVEDLIYNLQELNTGNFEDDDLIEASVFYDTTKFNPIAAGQFYIEKDFANHFEDIDTYCQIWTTSSLDDSDNYAPAFIIHNEGEILKESNQMYINLNFVDQYKGCMKSVRCIEI